MHWRWVPVLVFSLISTVLAVPAPPDPVLGPPELDVNKLEAYNELWTEYIQGTYRSYRKMKTTMIVLKRPHEDEAAVVEEETEKLKKMLKALLETCPRGENAAENPTEERYPVDDALVDSLMTPDKKAFTLIDLGQVFRGAAAQAQSIWTDRGKYFRRFFVGPAGPPTPRRGSVPRFQKIRRRR